MKVVTDSTAEALRDVASALATEVHDAMYRDPFWMERFGEAGVRYSLEDAAHHVRYLADAIDAAQPSVFTDYVVWVRGVLTTRGMCTLHLDRALGHLGDAIEARGLDAAGDARRTLESGRRALVYVDGDARGIQLAADGIAGRVAGAPDAAALDMDETRHLLSYAADAAAVGEDRVFVDHVKWLRGWLARRGVAGARFDALLFALEEAGGPPALSRLSALGMETAP